MCLLAATRPEFTLPRTLEVRHADGLERGAAWRRSPTSRCRTGGSPASSTGWSRGTAGHRPSAATTAPS